MSHRLDARLGKLRRDGRGGLSVYLPFGYPTPNATAGLLDAAVAGGADWIELGLPFSDPVADGPTLQAASARALAAGATVDGAVEAATAFRRRHPHVPLVAMTYGNVVLRRGWDGFAASLAAAGMDGLVCPDVPLEEAEPLRSALAAHGLAHVPLVTPATPDGRMAAIAATATGFLYVVASLGVTGQSDPGPAMRATVRRARAARADLPLAVGFGVRSPADVGAVVAAGADAAIVGSHLVKAMDAGPTALAGEVSRLASGVRGPGVPVRLEGHRTGE